MKKYLKIIIPLLLVVVIGIVGFLFWSKNKPLNEDNFYSLAESMRIESQDEFKNSPYSISVISDYSNKTITVDFVANKSKKDVKVDKAKFKNLESKLSKKHNKVNVSILVFDNNTTKLYEVK